MKKRILGLLICLFSLSVVAMEFPIINVGVDLTTFKIAGKNIEPSAEINQTAAFQTVLNYLEKAGGGVAIVPPGVYRVNKIVVPPKVEIIGSGRGKTIFRTAAAGDVFLMEGGAIRNFTVYGTPTKEVSGDNWRIGTGGKGKGGTARAICLIALREPRGQVVVDNIEALEARYDCLYVRNCNGLTVTNSHFDRAGRNIFSIVGNANKFIFSGCYFGSNWGLYHSDIEPNKGRWAKNGVIVNCVFDGRQGGKRWGKMFTFSGMDNKDTKNITVLDCLFQRLAVRIRGSFPRTQFLYNNFAIKGLNTAILQVRTNKGAALPDCRIIGNVFDGIKPRRVIYNVAVTGNPIITGNTPKIEYKKSDAPQDSSWQEDHPAILKGKQPIEIKAEKNGITFVKMPMMGYEFNFSSGKVEHRHTKVINDIAIHSDPMIAIENARFSRSSNFNDPDLKNLSYGSQLWNVKPGDVIVVKTNAGKIAVMEILGLGKQDISFRYRILK